MLRPHVTRKHSVLLWFFIFLGVGVWRWQADITLLPIHDNVHDKNDRNSTHQSEMKALASNSTLSIRQYHQRHMCFVHLGKTGGSSITCSLPPKIQKSGIGSSGCSSQDNAANQNNTSSALSQAIIERVHLLPAPAQNPRFDSFLVTVRNPLERIISWYYYLHPNYPPQKLPHHRNRCYNYQEFYQCWPTIQNLTEIGLQRVPDNYYKNWTKYNQTQTETDKCIQLAWDTISGIHHCWHNYWNFERTYSPLLLSLLQQPAAPQPNNKTLGRQELFVIRTEYISKDWASIETMLQPPVNSTTPSNSTGLEIPGGDEQARINPTVLVQHKNGFEKHENINSNNETKQSHSSFLSISARQNLCRALCREIQIYKQLLQLAINLDEMDKEVSLSELEELCPNRGNSCHIQYYNDSLPDDPLSIHRHQQQQKST
ncbi:hypothetical protein QTG54_009109 [Skeletonema marinoi]|uniref:Sulfotransferase domain-containing protein n=1 Tax=Skeletonema marinoi TaxID=267567 RepID=A0AAD9DBR2_9STRA|nr:hypothetical protein QTG54_009109 [Skeletonema marinoi]|mmetsp:Transcript_15327/g.31144  ORF Transcript_15327/g.31144 Transcript_15327/m.31144 type:complete len:429 (-) Transcript_15327:287-1573(-)